MRFHPDSGSLFKTQMILSDAVVPPLFSRSGFERFDGMRDAPDDDDVIFIRESAVVDGGAVGRASVLAGTAVAKVTNVTISGVDADHCHLFAAVYSQSSASR